jgi:hypothetical protein
MKGVRAAVALGVVVAAFAGAATPASADVIVSCSDASTKIGFNRWTPATCAGDYRCTWAYNCVAYARLTVDASFSGGTAKSVRGQGQFETTRRTSALLLVDPMVLDCTATRPAGGASATCVAEDSRVVLPNDRFDWVCRAPVGLLGLPILPPKGVAVSVSCRVYFVFVPSGR